jgi:hypothetical protein
VNAPDFLLDTRLSDAAARLAEVMNRRVRRCYTDCLYSAETFAKLLGWSVRKVRDAVNELIGLGLVERITDYGLRTRRRLRLRWRVFAETMAEPAAEDIAPNASTKNEVGFEWQQEFAVMSAVPPDPPIKVSEDILEGGRTDDPPAGEPAPPAEEVESSSLAADALPPEEGEPPPEVIAALVEVAAPILGNGPETVGRVKTLARKFAPSWVRKALGIAARKATREPITWGYPIRVLEGFQREGGPPAEVPAASRPSRAEKAAQIRALLAAGKPSGEKGP